VEAGGCGGDWSVTNSTGNEVVLSGKTAELHTLERGHLCLVNFTALNATGEYRLNVGGIGHAADSFRIGPSALNKPFSMAMAGFYMARCGQATPALPESDELVTATGSGRKFEHKACHMDDGLIDAKHTHEPVDSHVNATGGWHDAGDYGKYSINTAFTVGVLMYGWEHFRSRMECMTLGLPAGEPRLPDYLDEVRWGVAWLLKMQRPDGFVYHKLTPSHFESFGDLSHEDRSARYMAPWSTAATADLAAVGAQCARVFAKFDSPLAGRCLSAARRAYEALQAHPDQQLPDLSGFGTGAYVIHDPWRESGLRMWAAIELYETTREVPFLADAEERLRSFDAPLEACLVKEQVEAGPRCKVAERMDWDEQRNLGVIRYLTLALGRDRDLRSPALVRELREHLAVCARAAVHARRAARTRTPCHPRALAVPARAGGRTRMPQLPACRLDRRAVPAASAARARSLASRLAEPRAPLTRALSLALAARSRLLLALVAHLAPRRR
jgi:endoglucanase